MIKHYTHRGYHFLAEPWSSHPGTTVIEGLNRLDDDGPLFQFFNLVDPDDMEDDERRNKILDIMADALDRGPSRYAVRTNSIGVLERFEKAIANEDTHNATTQP